MSGKWHDYGLEKSKYGKAATHSGAGHHSALAGTPANCNTVATFSPTINAPPTQSEMQAVVDKMNELINVLRR